MKIRLVVMICLLLLLSTGFVVAQEGVVYYPTAYEYPNPNLMTNDIKLTTYYYKTNELSPMYANGEWGYHYYDEDGNIIESGILVISIDAYEIVGYPDYLEAWEYEAYAATIYAERESFYQDQGFSDDEAEIYAKEYVEKMEENADGEDVKLEITDAEFSKKVGYYTLRQLDFHNSSGISYSLEPCIIKIVDEAQNYVGGYFDTTSTRDTIDYIFTGKFTEDFVKIKNGVFYDASTMEEHPNYPTNYINAEVTTWTALKDFDEDEYLPGGIDGEEDTGEEDTGEEDTGEETVYSPLDASEQWKYWMLDDNDDYLYSGTNLQIAVVEQDGKYMMTDCRFELPEGLGFMVLEDTEIKLIEVGGDVIWGFEETNAKIEVETGDSEAGGPLMSSQQDVTYIFRGFFNEEFNEILDPVSKEIGGDWKKADTDMWLKWGADR